MGEGLDVHIRIGDREGEWERFGGGEEASEICCKSLGENPW